MADEAELRMAALDAASRVYGSTAQRHATLEGAQAFFDWLGVANAPTRLDLTVGPITKQGPTTPEGTPVQLHDDEQFTLSLAEFDAKGQPVTGDTISWTVDNTDVVSLQVSADTYSCLVVAGNVGSAVITVTDGTLSATEAVDVVPGTVAKITLSEGAAEPQPAAAPAPADGSTAAAPGDGSVAATTDASGTPAQDGTADTSGTTTA